MKLKDIGDPDASDDAAEPDPTEAADDEPAEEPEDIFNSSTGVPLATHDYNGWRLAYCKNDITDVHRNTAIVLTRLRKIGSDRLRATCTSTVDETHADQATQRAAFSSCGAIRPEG